MTLRRVVKLGGSLLTREDLISRLPEWFSQIDREIREPVENLVLVGGGALVDAIRSLDLIHPGDPHTIHWMCVDLMETNMRLVQAWFPHWKVLLSPQELRTCGSRGFETDSPSLVSVASFYRRDTLSVLPNDWSTTSDSIAAKLAIEIDADELILLKSCKIDPKLTVEELAAAGIVDEALPMMAASIRHLRVHELK